MMTRKRLKSWQGAGLVLLALACVGAGTSDQIMIRRDRWVEVSHDRAWEASFEVIRRGGWEVLRAEKGKGLIQTGWYEFAEGTFGPNVAIKPPRLTWEYGYYHIVKLASGRSRLKISVVPSKGGIRVSVHASVQEYSFHRDLREWDWVSRDSNGSIERFFMERLGEILEGKTSVPEPDPKAPDSGPREANP
jgi:hypothetical protein